LSYTDYDGNNIKDLYVGYSSRSSILIKLQNSDNSASYYFFQTVGSNFSFDNANQVVTINWDSVEFDPYTNTNNRFSVDDL